MSQINLYSIKDVDTGTFAPPFLAYGDTEAKQMVRDAIEPRSMLHLYPAHYHLYRVAVMDPATGDVTPDKMCICSVGDLTYRLPDPAQSLQEAAREEEACE